MKRNSTSQVSKEPEVVNTLPSAEMVPESPRLNNKSHLNDQSKDPVASNPRKEPVARSVDFLSAGKPL